MPSNALRLARLVSALSIVTLSSSACQTVTVVAKPKACPEVNERALMEVADMRMKGIYPNTQDWVFEAWAYCEYIAGLRGDPEDPE